MNMGIRDLAYARDSAVTTCVVEDPLGFGRINSEPDTILGKAGLYLRDKVLHPWLGVH